MPRKQSAGSGTELEYTVTSITPGPSDATTVVLSPVEDITPETEQYFRVPQPNLSLRLMPGMLEGIGVNDRVTMSISQSYDWSEDGDRRSEETVSPVGNPYYVGDLSQQEELTGDTTEESSKENE